MTKVIKMLLGACLEAISQVLALVVFMIMAAGAVMLISAIIILGFVWDKAIKLKRAMKRIRTSEVTG
jgi:hypothetical protein